MVVGSSRHGGAPASAPTTARRGPVWCSATSCARTVRDDAAVLDAITGPLPGDPYTAPRPPVRTPPRWASTPAGSASASAPTHRAASPRSTHVVEAVEDAARLLESLGHVVEPASPAGLDAPGLLEAFSAVLASSVVFDIDGSAKMAGHAITADDVEPFTWMQYELGKAITAGQYLEGLHVAHQWTRGVVAWWQDYDLLLTANTAEPAPRLGDIVDASFDPFRASSGRSRSRCSPVRSNITGQPTVSLPLWWTPDGIPVGVQLVADQYREDLLFRVAAQLEAARPWTDRRPPVRA